MLRGPDRLYFFLNEIILKITCADLTPLCYKIVSIENHPTLLNCTDRMVKLFWRFIFKYNVTRIVLKWRFHLLANQILAKIVACTFFHALKLHYFYFQTDLPTQIYNIFARAT